MTNLELTPEAAVVLQLGEALERLLNNDDFKKVILEGYLKDEVLATALKLSYGYTRNTDGLIEDLKSASNLAFYIEKVKGDYESMKEDIKEESEGE